MVQDCGLGPAFVEMGPGPGVFTLSFSSRGSAQAHPLPFPTAPPRFPAVCASMLNGGQDLTLFSELVTLS